MISCGSVFSAVLGLAHAHADATVAVADHHERGEREAAAALDNLRHAVDVDDALLKLGDRGVVLFVTSHRP